MKAIIYETFNTPPQLKDVPDPAPETHGVIVKVMATGVCRSDWHGWVGHDADIQLPHVPGHESVGVVAAVGKDVTRWKSGDRVTVLFVGGCGACPQCAAGNQQVCDHQFQPGFTHLRCLIRADRSGKTVARKTDWQDNHAGTIH